MLKESFIKHYTFFGYNTCLNIKLTINSNLSLQNTQVVTEIIRSAFFNIFSNNGLALMRLTVTLLSSRYTVLIKAIRFKIKAFIARREASLGTYLTSMLELFCKKLLTIVNYLQNVSQRSKAKIQKIQKQSYKKS